MNWHLAVTLSNFLIIPVKTFRLGVYLLEEVSVLLLAIAAATVVTLLLLVALILFVEGARLGFFWLRVGAVQCAVLVRHLSAHRGAMTRLNIRR